MRILIVAFMLDVAYFTLWNLATPVLINQSAKCTAVSIDSVDLHLITTVLQWLFCAELFILWIFCRSYSHCMRVYGVCLTDAKRDLMERDRVSQALDRKLHEQWQRSTFSVKRILLLGPANSGKRRFLQSLCQLVHAGKLPGIQLREFAGLVRHLSCLFRRSIWTFCPLD